MIVRTSPSVSYSVWLKRILDAHTTQAWDMPPSDTQEREDEELNDLWTEIDDDQKRRLWGLSSDLNTLRDCETWVESDWPPMTKEELARAQADAFQKRDWDTLLEHLRRPPRFLPGSTIDYLRGRAWMEMGHPEAAVLFFDNAQRMKPEHANYGAYALECLKAMQNWPEVLRRCEEYKVSRTTPARLLFRAADALMYASHAGEQDRCQQALEAVEEGFRRLNQLNQPEPLTSVLIGAYATKAFCLAHLGRGLESLQTLNQAVELFPETTALLAARGLLKQELRLGEAVDDLREAVDRGTPIVWAHAALARHELHEGQTERAIELCRSGLALAQQDRAKASLFELLAIALFERGGDLEAVRAAFQIAAEFDPLSEQIRTNRERFEVFAANPQAGKPQWLLASQASGAALREVYAQLQLAA